MALAQKQAQNKQEEALREANLVFRSLDTQRYGPIMPVGLSIDKLGLPDFFSGQSQTLHLFNVRHDEVKSLLGKTVDDLTAALAKYSPAFGGKSEFTAVKVTYTGSKDKVGELEFTLKIVEKPAPTLLAKK